jgi:hypothetical protein
MTESEWQTCTDPKLMLEFLKGRVSDRKLRLFAVACCRRVRHRMTDERGHHAVEVAEKYAEGLANSADLAFSSKIAWSSWTTPADAAARDVVESDPIAAALNASRHASWAAQGVPRSHELQIQVELLRDVAGNPFRSPNVIVSAVLIWNENTVRRLAESIYAQRAFDGLPILADALEEADCTNTDILNHCRQPGEHARGCWVIDLILGKK